MFICVDAVWGNNFPVQVKKVEQENNVKKDRRKVTGVAPQKMTKKSNKIVTEKIRDFLKFPRVSLKVQISDNIIFAHLYPLVLIPLAAICRINSPVHGCEEGQT